jgi:curved DNA-binding protein
MDISKDFYNILEVSSDATEDEIKNSYRKLAKKYHPDSNTTSDDHMFQLVQSAWDILGNTQKRLDYDKKLKKNDWESVRDEKLSKFQKNGASSGEARPILKDSWSYPKVNQVAENVVVPNFVDRLKTIASGKSVETATEITKRALLSQLYPEQKATIKITPFELWFGVKKELNINSLGGLRKIKVKIPRGFILGSILNVDCPLTEDYPEQAVKIIIELSEHPNVKIEGLDLHIDLPISYSEAILGDEIIIPTPLTKIKLRIPAKFEIGKKIKIAGNGIEEKNRIGDLYVKPYIAEIPESEMLIKVLAKLDQLYPGDIRGDILSDLTTLKSDD